MRVTAARQNLSARRTPFEHHGAVVRQREQRAWVQSSAAQVGVCRPLDDPFGCGTAHRLRFEDRDRGKAAGIAVLDMKADQIWRHHGQAAQHDITEFDRNTGDVLRRRWSVAQPPLPPQAGRLAHPVERYGLRPCENASCEVSDAACLPAMTVEARLID